MKVRCAALVLSAAVFMTPCWGQVAKPNPPLVVNGDTALTTLDFEAHMLRVPEKLRSEFRSAIQRVTKTVDALWVQRMVASRAVAAGLADDPLVAARIRQAQELVLQEAYLQKLDAGTKFPANLSARAKEVYAANPGAYKLVGRVHVQHVLVDLKCRTREAALKRASEIRAEIVAGKEDFTAIARRMSDDPSVDKNGGDLGLLAPKILDDKFQAEVAKMSKPGELSEPFESKFGYHIVRLVRREPDRNRSFEEVKDEIVDAEKAKIIDEGRTRLLAEIRNDPKNYLYMENVEALVERPREAAQAPSVVDTKPR